MAKKVYIVLTDEYRQGHRLDVFLFADMQQGQKFIDKEMEKHRNDEHFSEDVLKIHDFLVRTATFTDGYKEFAGKYREVMERE